MTWAVTALVALGLAGGGFLAFRRRGGKGALFISGILAGYFSALSAGWLNGWVRAFFPDIPWGVLLSAGVEEGVKVALLGLVLRFPGRTGLRGAVFLGGALWLGFGLFESLMIHLGPGGIPGFFWLPLVLHFILGMLWAGSGPLRKRVFPLRFLLLTLAHAGFNLMMVQGFWPGALVLTGLLASLVPWVDFDPYAKKK